MGVFVSGEGARGVSELDDPALGLAISASGEEEFVGDLDGGDGHVVGGIDSEAAAAEVLELVAGGDLPALQLAGRGAGEEDASVSVDGEALDGAGVRSEGRDALAGLDGPGAGGAVAGAGDE